MGSGGNGGDLPPGTVKVSPEKQQMIGVKVATVEKTPWSHTKRLLGRVTPDETRIYRINAALNGWIEDVQPVTTGSIVKKNELLATFYSVDYRTTVQVYLNLIRSSKPAVPGTHKPAVPEAKGEEKNLRLSPSQLKPMRDVLKDVTRDLNFSSEASQKYYYKKSLLNFGISEYQIDEWKRAEPLPMTLKSALRSRDSFSRECFSRTAFRPGIGFFRIADLSRVWIWPISLKTRLLYTNPEDG